MFRPRAQNPDFGQLAFVGGAALLVMLHVAAAFTVVSAVAAGERIAAERREWVVVDQCFIDALSEDSQGSTFDKRRATGRRALRVKAAPLRPDLGLRGGARAT